MNPEVLSDQSRAKAKMALPFINLDGELWQEPAPLYPSPLLKTFPSVLPASLFDTVLAELSKEHPSASAEESGVQNKNSRVYQLQSGGTSPLEVALDQLGEIARAQASSFYPEGMPGTDGSETGVIEVVPELINFAEVWVRRIGSKPGDELSTIKVHYDQDDSQVSGRGERSNPKKVLLCDLAGCRGGSGGLPPTTPSLARFRRSSAAASAPAALCAPPF
jgi:hypothetical protein